MEPHFGSKTKKGEGFPANCCGPSHISPEQYWFSSVSSFHLPGDSHVLGEFSAGPTYPSDVAYLASPTQSAA